MIEITEEMEQAVIEQLRSNGWIIAADLDDAKSHLESEGFLVFTKKEFNDCVDEAEENAIEKFSDDKHIFKDDEELEKYFLDNFDVQDVLNEGLSLGEVNSGIKL